ncbi:MAG: FliH/SctL family protein [Eubacterium sp.]|nr:FliH/SctL family protein [Eubacterium sp.]
MSNVVKYPFVNIQGKEARKVSYEKPGAFTPLEPPKKKVVVRDAAEVEEEIAMGLSLEDIFNVQKSTVMVGGDDEDEAEDEAGDAGFEAGLEVKNITKEIEQKREEAQAEADEIIAAAREQADEIVVEARQQADDIRAQAHDEGFEAGREEGLLAGEAETAKIREGIEEERRALEGEYESLVRDLEPQFVRVVCELIEKLTGVVISDQEELVLHLIRSGLSDVRKNTERIIVRVCPEDAMVAEAHKKELMEQLEWDATIEVQSQDSMEKNECIIETDNQMLDAGIRTQLDNMLMAIKMLV